MKFLSLTFLFFSFSAFAQTVITADKAAKLAVKLTPQDQQKLKDAYIKVEENDQEKTAARLIALDLAPFIKTLNRNINTYNYRTRAETGIQPNEFHGHDSAQVVKSSQEWASATKKYLPKEQGMFGWGLYTARDPVLSDDYATDQNDFVMTTVNYPAGARMLDLRKTEGAYIPLSAKTVDYVKQICGASFSQNLYPRSVEGESYYFAEKTNFNLSDKCNRILVNAMSSLNLSGIMYQWSNKQVDFSTCDNKEKISAEVAFVAYDLPITTATTEVLTNPKGNEAKLTKEDQIAFKKIAILRSNSKERFRFGADIDFNVATAKFSKAEEVKLTQELKRETFGCDLRDAENDKAHYDPNQAYTVLLKDVLPNLDKSLQLKVRDCLN